MAEGYSEYQKAEASLSDTQPKRMSYLTHNLLNAINYERVALQRVDNFTYLHQRLEQINLLALPSKSVAAMVYPLLLDKPMLKSALISRSIFVATYWPEVLSRCDGSELEANLVNNLVCLPCDQRYNESDLDYMLKVLFEELEGAG